MWAVQHLSEICHYSVCTCKHGDILTGLYLHTGGLCLMHLPLTRPDPDPHLQADTPAHLWLVPISKQVPSTQDCGCPSLPWLPRISNWGCGIGSGWLSSCLTSPRGPPHLLSSGNCWSSQCPSKHWI